MHIVKHIASHTLNIIIAVIISSICTSVGFIVANTFYTPSGFITLYFGNDFMILMGSIYGLFQGSIISIALYILKKKSISLIYISLIPTVITTILLARNINDITTIVFVSLNGIGNYITTLVSQNRIITDK
jgi:hypothetical protein